MSYPCPNGCQRDAGEYCNRHSCDLCSERLSPEDTGDICNECIQDAKIAGENYKTMLKFFENEETGQ